MNRSQALQALTRGRIRVSVPDRPSTLFLTFDDGPSPRHTERLLAVLARFSAKATFFLIGQNAESHRDIAEAIVAQGHSLGNHSFSHPRFRRIKDESRRMEIELTESILCSIDGRPTHPFRPPRGELAPAMIWDCLSGRSQITLWTHDSLDYRSSKDAVVTRCRDLPLKGGEILLFHDDGACASESLLELLPYWQSRKFSFAAL
jgi:peptidoglycan/xylan/chitin deacetylase (PgdA/CDA1 family)